MGTLFRRTAVFVGVGLFFALVLAVFVSPFASTSPDGLERVAGDLGLMGQTPEKAVWDSAPIPDYSMPGVHDARVATGLAGAVGVIVMFGGSYGIAKVLIRTKRRDDASLSKPRS